jgi:hypothetical protein
MLTRLAAFCLVALVIAPCTAPFQTCDLPTLLGHPSRQIPENTSHSTARANDVSVANVPAVSQLARARVLKLSRVSRSIADHVAMMTVVARASCRADREVRSAILTTVLRL